MIGCSPGNNSSNNNQENNNYESTKKMVTDILKTEDGKKAIIDVLAEDSTQKIYVIHDETVKVAIEEALTSEKGKEFWSQMFGDQEFVKEFSESMMDQQEDVFKRLMGDSTYQEKLFELFENPEFGQLVQSQLKSQQFKSYLEESIQETLESPLFQAKVSEIIVQHAKDIAGEKDKQGKSGSESDQNGQQSESGDSQGNSGNGSSQ